MNLDNKVLTLDDGNKYIIVEKVELEGQIYVYLLNTANVADALFKELTISGDKMVVSDIDTTLFSEKIFPLFKEKIQNS